MLITETKDIPVCYSNKTNDNPTHSYSPKTKNISLLFTERIKETTKPGIFHPPPGFADFIILKFTSSNCESSVLHDNDIIMNKHSPICDVNYRGSKISGYLYHKTMPYND